MFCVGVRVTAPPKEDEGFLFCLSLRWLLLLLAMVDIKKQSEKKFETSNPAIELGDKVSKSS